MKAQILPKSQNMYPKIIHKPELTISKREFEALKIDYIKDVRIP